MDAWLLLKAALMGVVEGLTEFLPISSTGHLIVAASLLDLHGSTVQVFEIAIQTGAMVAVIWEYRARLAATLRGATHDPLAKRFIVNLAVAFLPAAVLGFLFGSAVKAHLFHPVPVALAFVLGGFVILWVERRPERIRVNGNNADVPHTRVESVDQMTPMDALKVGLVQCVALIPGTSRSGATIIGAMLFGFSRRAATEFSFYLGIPTLIAAGGYALYKSRAALHLNDLPLFAIGLICAFGSALVCIRWLIRYVSTHDFVPFAWYRIAFGLWVLVSAYFGWVDWRV